MVNTSLHAGLPVFFPAELSIILEEFNFGVLVLFGSVFAVSIEPSKVTIVELLDLLIFLLLGQPLGELNLSNCLAVFDTFLHASLPVFFPAELGILKLRELEGTISIFILIEVKEVIGVGKFITKGEV
jgi:hypothetical protein